MTSTYQLDRSGSVPLRFQGEQIAAADGEEWQRRRHECTIYRTAAGKLVAGLDFISEWGAEVGYSQAFIGDERDGLVAQLLAHDPAAHAFGYPPLPDFESRQRRLVAEVVARYREMLEIMFERAGWVEEIA